MNTARRVARRYVARQRAYCFCKPTDGMLYVEVPKWENLLNLLLTQQWRGEPHLRTVKGYVPYHQSGGIAFDFKALRLKGVQPTWYDVGDYHQAIEQLLEDGIYPTLREAERNHQQPGYAGECEWVGPRGMKFDLGAVRYVWLGRKGTDEQEARLREFLPSNLPIVREGPPSGGSPCK